jgi:LAS superfamily LD-carboxypeptidase LdcB
MARLPVDIAELSNRNEMPTGALQTPEASARNFGGAAAQALGGFGDALSGLAAKIEANKRQSAGFDAEQQFIKLQEEDARAYEESKRGLAGSGDGFWEAARADTNKRYDDFVESLPKWAQDEYRTKAERQKAARSNTAFGDQYAQQDNNSRAVLSDEDRKAGLGVQANPRDFEAFRQRQYELIDKSTLPAAEKEQRKREIDSALAVTAAESDAVNNPGMVMSTFSSDSGSTFDWQKHRSKGGSRPDAISGMDAGFRTALEGLIASAPPEIKGGLSVFSGYRSVERQQELWDASDKSGKMVARPGHSQHNHGRAADIEWNGVRLDKAPKEVQDWVAANLAKFGLTRPMDYEPWHVEIVGARGGKTAAVAAPGVAAGPDAAVPPDYVQYLTPDQKSAYYRTAERAFQGEMDAAQAVADAQRKASQDAVLLGILEGPDPEGAYKKGRDEGLFGSFEEVKRADAALAGRQEKDADATRGLDLMSGAVPGDRNSTSDKKAVNGAYNVAVNAGVDPSEAARVAFDKTNIIPPDYARGLVAGAATRDPAKAEQSFIAAANILGTDPNAFNGVSNSGPLVDDAFEFKRRTETLGQSSADAAAAILADRARPPASAAAQEEGLKAFRKDALTPEAVEAGLAVAAENGWGADGRIPAGAETGGDAMRSIYRGLAEEGFRKFGNPERAIAYAAKEVERRFGVFNGTLIQYPPDKAGLPKLPKADDPYAWVAEQAATVAAESLGLDVPPGQVVLVPVEERGVSTRAGFNGLGTVIPGQSGETTVPYSVVVMPDDGSPAMLVPGVFLPDINEYVKTKNAELASVPAPFTAAPPLLTPEEGRAAERQTALEQQAAEEARRGKVKMGYKGPGARNQEF